MTTIPFVSLARQNESIRDRLDDAYRRVMESGWFILGAELEAFEEEFAQHSEVKYCIGVGNGLDALHFLLLAYGVGPGDEVIVPSNTFIATWLAVSQCGATPIPVEPDINSFNINPSLIENVSSLFICMDSRQIWIPSKKLQQNIILL
jgi:dTDP-4-amino-4,6-dideoxygalactose transaminase